MPRCARESILHHMRTIRFCCFLSAVMLITWTQSSAQMVDWVIRGRLTQVDSHPPPWAKDVHVGDLWELRYHVSGATADWVSESEATYYWAVPGEVRLGSYVRTLELSHIQVVYNHGATDYITLHGDVWGFFCDVILESSKDVLPDGALGAVVPLLSNFDLRRELHSGSTWQSSFDWIADGIATEFYTEAVPEPSTYGLGALLLLAVLIGRRRCASAQS